jgi:subtilisin family serine protease
LAQKKESQDSDQILIELLSDTKNKDSGPLSRGGKTMKDNTTELIHARRVLARRWEPKIVEKLDNQLSLNLVSLLVSEAVPKEKFRVILHLPQLKLDISEAVSPSRRRDKMNRLTQWANQSQLPVLEKLIQITTHVAPMNLTKRIASTPSAAEGTALIDEALRTVPAICRRMPLTNTIVADLTPDQIKIMGERSDITFIEMDKPALPELNMSTVFTGIRHLREMYHLDGEGIFVAVIGGEVDADHPDLAGRVIHKRSYDDPFGTPSQHETLVAGIIAGNGNNSNGNLVGVAPGATIWSYKTSLRLDLPGHDKAQAILDAAADGAHVINCSWKVEGTPRNGTCLWCKAVDTAVEMGAIVIKSCGNQGPGPENDGTTTCPANAQHVISVGATSEDGTRMALSLGLDFSSRGPTSDGRAKPELVAPGENINGPLPGGEYSSDFYGDGTSFAAPHVAGVAALLLQANSSLTPSQVREALLHTAKKIQIDGQNLPQNTQGAGFLDAEGSVQYVAHNFGGTFSAAERKESPMIMADRLQVSRTGPPPRFAVYLGRQRHYAVEIATESFLFELEALHPARRHFNQAGVGSPNFYGSWFAAPILLTSSDMDTVYDLPEPVWNAFNGNPELYFRVISSDSPTSWENPRFSPVNETEDNPSFLRIFSHGSSMEVSPRIITVTSEPRFYVFTGNNSYFALEIALESAIFNLPHTHPDKRIYPAPIGQTPTFFATWTAAPPLLHGQGFPVTYSPHINIWEAFGHPSRIFFRLITSRHPESWSQMEISTPLGRVNRASP